MRKLIALLVGVSTMLLSMVVYAGPPKPSPAGTRFPATGQTTSYLAGDDGAIRAGSPLSYTDNGDGTFIDNNTKLIWEKKDQSGGLHDVLNTYPWSSIFDWVGQLDTAPCFANHCDWRIPNVKELQSLADYGQLSPAVSPSLPGATQSSASQSYYWSSTTDLANTDFVWVVSFAEGGVLIVNKSVCGGCTNFPYYVRAVRGGL